MNSEIEFQDWDDEDEEMSEGHIGPVSFMDLVLGKKASVTSALFGCPVYYMVNERYGTEELNKNPNLIFSAYKIFSAIGNILKTKDYSCIVFVSDGYFSHVINPVRMEPIGTTRLVYWDPWGEKSFLEKDGNIVGVEAKKEEGRHFSITFSEFEKVVVGVELAHLAESPLGEKTKKIKDNETEN